MLACKTSGLKTNMDCLTRSRSCRKCKRVLVYVLKIYFKSLVVNGVSTTAFAQLSQLTQSQVFRLANISLINAMCVKAETFVDIALVRNIAT